MSITGLSRLREEHQSIVKIFTEQDTLVEFYNELDACFVCTRISFGPDVRKGVLNFIGEVEELFSSELDESASSSLDSFEYTLNKERIIQGTREIGIYIAEGQFSEFKIMQNYFLGSREHFKLEINNIDDGELLERIVWAALEPVFSSTLYKNPQIKAGKIFRELTDIFAFYEFGTFMIESKSLSVTSLEKERNMERKVNTIQKHVKKAINQIVGATKAFKRGDIISDSKGCIIMVDRSVVLHCLVLLSDLYPIGDWTMIESLMLSTIKEQRIFLNVMDVRELLKHLKSSRGDPRVFDYNLIDRTRTFVQTGNIHIESRLK